MLYILLIIIAVGVLLASEAGQELLKWLIILLVVGGLLYLAFWVILFVGVFVANDITARNEFAGAVLISLSVLAVYFLDKIKGKIYSKFPITNKWGKKIKIGISKFAKIFVYCLIGILAVLLTYLVYLAPPL